ncbi:MAG: TIGR00730 family Rossman fold protein [bacterium]
MEKDLSPKKAYNNLEFLNSPEARTIRILSEFYEPKARFEKENIQDTIVFFGSARLLSGKDAAANLNAVKENQDKNTYEYAVNLKKAEKLVEMSHYYDEAEELAQRLTKWSSTLPGNGKRLTVCSGGGPGVMEAANKGAFQAGGKSIGLNISIPFEQFVNTYVPNELAFEFHYFFMRKFWFVYLAKALIVFPGGFGTLDEMMEVLTLIQTKKVTKHIKIIVYDSNYWKKVINFDALAESGMISPEDMNILDFCDTIDEVYEKITKSFENNFLHD